MPGEKICECLLGNAHVPITPDFKYFHSCCACSLARLEGCLGRELQTKWKCRLPELGRLCFQPDVDVHCTSSLLVSNSCCFFSGDGDDGQQWHPYKTSHWKDLTLSNVFPFYISLTDRCYWTLPSTVARPKKPQSPSKDAFGGDVVSIYRASANSG